jgi:hypothetical protein
VLAIGGQSQFNDLFTGRYYYPIPSVVLLVFQGSDKAGENTMLIFQHQLQSDYVLQYVGEYLMHPIFLADFHEHAHLQ